MHARRKNSERSRIASRLDRATLEASPSSERFFPATTPCYRLLANGPLTGRYRVENGHLPDRSATASISRADVAHFLLSELEHRAYIHYIVGIARGKRDQT